MNILRSTITKIIPIPIFRKKSSLPLKVFDIFFFLKMCIRDSLRTVLTVLFILDCIGLSVIVLMQEGKSQGLGVQKAVEHVNTELAEAVLGENVLKQGWLDKLLPVSYTHLDVYKRQVW